MVEIALLRVELLYFQLYSEVIFELVKSIFRIVWISDPGHLNVKHPLCYSPIENYCAQTSKPDNSAI